MYNLRMLVVCSKCQAENEDIARFCNQCGAPLGNSLPENQAAAAAPAATGEIAVKSSNINWSGLVIIALVIGAIWYIVGSHPKSGGAGAGGAAPMMPPAVLEQIQGYKDALKANPADIETLRSMYETYGAVGKTAEVEPYTKAALDYLDANKGNLGNDELGDALLALFIAAYENRDDAACMDILKVYHVKFPDNLRILKVLGDLSYDQSLFEQAVEYYNQFLDQSKPEDDQESYLNALTDLGSCYIQIGNDAGDKPEMYDQALAAFDRVFAFNPDFWQARFNKGVALGKQEHVDQAVAEWEWCRDNTDNEMEKWRANYAIAEIRGEELPPTPANPHGEGFGGMVNPHGEGGMSMPQGGGMVNPHGEGAAPPIDGENLPPNPHSEEWLEQQRKQQDSSGDTAG